MLKTEDIDITFEWVPHSAGFTGRTARLMTGYILDYYGYGFNGIGSFHNSIINGIIETLKSGLTEENSNGTVPTDYIYSDFNISNNIICDIYSQENKKALADIVFGRTSSAAYIHRTDDLL